MQIKEYFIKGKVDTKHNEDGLYINDGIIAVIDGVTSKTKNLYQGFKSGKIAKDIIMQALKSIKVEMTAKETLEYINSELKRYQYLLGPNEYFSAQIIIYNDYYKEIWNFGDCNCMINGIFHNHDKLYDDITSQARALYNTILLKNGYTKEQLLEHDYGAEYIKPLLQYQYLFNNDINSSYGYPVLDGNDIHLEQLITYKVKPSDEIVLASDGYPIIKPTLTESEEYLKNLLKQDPLCIEQFISTKGLNPGNNSYDDRVYVRFII